MDNSLLQLSPMNCSNESVCVVLCRDNITMTDSQEQQLGVSLAWLLQLSRTTVITLGPIQTGYVSQPPRNTDILASSSIFMIM